MAVKLTCVTAVFNAVSSGNRERLVRCVESVAKLKTGHEHLIYDGASKDGTVELLRELEAKTPGLKVVSEPDTGIYNALNKGVRDAKGEWFYVLGCDDFISHPEVMDRLLEDKVSGKHDVIVAPVERDNGKKEFYWGYSHMKRLFRENPCSHQGLIMRTPFVRQTGGFNESYRLAADYDIQLRAQLACMRHLYLTEPFALFADGGMSAECVAETLAEIREIARKRLGLSERENEAFRRTCRLPARKVAMLAFSGNPLLRRISLGQIRMLMARILKPWSK